MKKLIFTVALFLIIGITTSCMKTSLAPVGNSATSTQRVVGTVWMRYDETMCNNPWNFDWLKAPTDEQLIGAVKSYLRAYQVNILEMRTSLDEKISTACTSCSCPNGRHYFARMINKADIDLMKSLGFYEVKDVPAPSIADLNNTK